MKTRTIHKFDLDLRGVTVLPAGEVLLVSDQNGALRIWIADADDGRRRSFIVIGTGQTVPKDSAHVGSCQAGAYVWHVFACDVFEENQA